MRHFFADTVSRFWDKRRFGAEILVRFPHVVILGKTNQAVTHLTNPDDDQAL
jgi:hypothetical protein